jgi:hypothetical protein
MKKVSNHFHTFLVFFLFLKNETIGRMIMVDSKEKMIKYSGNVMTQKGFFKLRIAFEKLIPMRRLITKLKVTLNKRNRKKRRNIFMELVPPLKSCSHQWNIRWTEKWILSQKNDSFLADRKV